MNGTQMPKTLYEAERLGLFQALRAIRTRRSRHSGFALAIYHTDPPQANQLAWETDEQKEISFRNIGYRAWELNTMGVTIIIDAYMRKALPGETTTYKGPRPSQMPNSDEVLLINRVNLVAPSKTENFFIRYRKNPDGTLALKDGMKRVDDGLPPGTMMHDQLLKGYGI